MNNKNPKTGEPTDERKITIEKIIFMNQRKIRDYRLKEF